MFCWKRQKSQSMLFIKCIKKFIFVGIEFRGIYFKFWTKSMYNLVIFYLVLKFMVWLLS